MLYMNRVQAESEVSKANAIILNIAKVPIRHKDFIKIDAKSIKKL